MEPQDLVGSLQGHSTLSYPEPDESNPYHPIISL
jgi:hypothetical protein